MATTVGNTEILISPELNNASLRKFQTAFQARLQRIENQSQVEVKARLKNAAQFRSKVKALTAEQEQQVKLGLDAVDYRRKLKTATAKEAEQKVKLAANEIAYRNKLKAATAKAAEQKIKLELDKTKHEANVRAATARAAIQEVNLELKKVALYKAQVAEATRPVKQEVKVDFDRRAMSQFTRSMEHLRGQVQILRSAFVALRPIWMAAAGAAVFLTQALVHMVGSLAQASTAAMALPVAFGAIVQVAGAVFLATSNMSTAIFEYADSLKDAGGASKEFGEFLHKEVVPALQDFEANLRGILFPRFEKAFQNLAAHGHGFNQVMERSARVAGNFVVHLSRWATTAESLRDFNIIGQANIQMFRQLGRTVINLLDIIRNLWAAAIPMTIRFTTWLQRATGELRELTNEAREDGSLERFFQRAGSEAARWGRIISNVSSAIFHTFKAIGDVTSSFMDDFEAVTLRWKEWTKSTEGQERLHRFFQAIRDVDWGAVAHGFLVIAGAMAAINVARSALAFLTVLLGPAGSLIIGIASITLAISSLMSTNEDFRKSVLDLGDALVPILQSFQRMAGEVLVALTPMLVSVAQLLGTIAETFGRLPVPIQTATAAIIAFGLAMRFAGPVGLAVTALSGLLAVTSSLSPKLEAAKIDTDQLALSLERLAESGRPPKSMIDALGGSLEQFGISTRNTIAHSESLEARLTNMMTSVAPVQGAFQRLGRAIAGIFGQDRFKEFDEANEQWLKLSEALVKFAQKGGDVERVMARIGRETGLTQAEMKKMVEPDALAIWDAQRIAMDGFRRALGNTNLNVEGVQNRLATIAEQQPLLAERMFRSATATEQFANWANALGISTDELADRIGVKLNPVLEAFHRKMQRADSRIGKMVESGRLNKANELLDQMRKDWRDAGGSMSDFGRQVPETQAALRRQLSQLRDTKGELDNVKDATDGATNAMKEYRDELRAATDPLFAYRRAEKNLKKVMRDGESTAIDKAEATADLMHAGVELTDVNPKLIDAMAENIEHFSDGEITAKDFKKQMRGILDRGTDLVADSPFKADVKVNNQKAIDDMEELLGSTLAFRWAIERPIDPKTGAPRGLVVGDGAGGGGEGSTSTPRIMLPPGFRRAGGGLMSGPGTGTSDSIIAMLSDGEFVQRAAAVEHYGPAFMNALNDMRIPKSALPNFRDGGMPHMANGGSTSGLSVGFSLGQSGFGEALNHLSAETAKLGQATTQDLQALLELGWNGIAGNHLEALYPPHVQLKKITNKEWKALKSKGWRGRAGELLKALYQPLKGVRGATIELDHAFSNGAQVFNSFLRNDLSPNLSSFNKELKNLSQATSRAADRMNSVGRQSSGSGGGGSSGSGGGSGGGSRVAKLIPPKKLTSNRYPGQPYRGPSHELFGANKGRKYDYLDDTYRGTYWKHGYLLESELSNLERKDLLDLGWKRSFNTGGMVTGPGSDTSDSISARLSSGEFVMRAAAVSHYGRDFMESLNDMDLSKEALPLLAEFMSGGKMIQEVWTNIIKPVFDALVNSVHTKITPAMQALANQGVIPAWASIQQSISSAWQSIRANALNPLVASVQTTLPAAFRRGRSAIINFGQAARQTLSGVSGHILMFSETLSSDLSQPIRRVSGQIGQFANKLVAVSERATSAWQAFNESTAIGNQKIAESFQISRNAVTTFGRESRQALSSVSRRAQGLGESLNVILAQPILRVGEVAREFSAGFITASNRAGGAWTRFGETVGRGSRRIASSFETMASVNTESLAQLQESVQRTGTQIFRSFQRLGRRLVSSWSTMWSNLDERWRGFVRGMVSSLREWIGNILEDISRLANRVENSWDNMWTRVNNRLVRASASVLDSIQTLARGIRERYDGVETATEQFANRLVQIFRRVPERLLPHLNKAIGLLRQLVKRISKIPGAKSEVKNVAGSLKALKLASGGMVRGQGTETSDSVPAMLSRNEFVMPANAVHHYGPEFMDAVRKKDLPTPAARLAVGGFPSNPGAMRGNSGVFQGITQLARKWGHNPRLTSGYRHGDPLWHGSGLAADLGGFNQDKLAGRFLAIKEDVLELIHRTNRGDYGVSRGKQWAPGRGNDVLNAHRDHIHIAMTKAAVEHYLGSKIPGAVGPGGFLTKTWKNDAQEAWDPLKGKFGKSLSRMRGVPFGPGFAGALKGVPGQLFGHLDRKDPGIPLGGAGLVGADGSVMRQALKQAESMNATKKVLLALFEAGFVESNFRNLRTAVDHDSLGFLQQRPSQGWGSRAQILNVPHATRSFVSRAMPIQGGHGTAGELAQAVQRSAFPERYNQAEDRARAALKGLGVKGFDTGGQLMPGMTPAVNATGDPEAVLTGRQWAAMISLAGQSQEHCVHEHHHYIDGEPVRAISREEVSRNNNQLKRDLTARKRK